MRWYVEISSLGTGGPPPSKLCVEAAQWQPALQKVRAMRNDDGPIGSFSIELLDDGYRAIDPNKRLRYVITKAPNDAPLSPATAAVVSLPPSAPSPAQAQVEPPKRPLAQTAAYGSKGAAVVRAEAEAVAQQKAVAPPRPASISTANATAVTVPQAPAIPRPAGTAVPQPPAAPAAPAETQSVPSAAPSMPIPSYRVLASREQSPTDSSPLTYREMVYVVPQGTNADVVEKLLLERFETVKKSVEGVQGKLINLAIFDHAFQGKPERPPLATLTWKDWRGEPEIKVANKKPSQAPAPAAEAAPKPPAANKSSPPAAPIAPKAPSNPPRAGASSPPKKSAEDLMNELAGAMTDLHFLSDPLEGADFIVALAHEKIPSELITVYFLDPDKRELVLVKQRGGKHDKLLTRMSEKTGLAQAVIRGGRAVVIADATRDPRAVEPRWKAMGVDAKSLISAPLSHGGKTFGLIEIVNPEGNGRYAAADGSALGYIGQQLGELCASQGIVLDADRITQAAKKAAR